MERPPDRNECDLVPADAQGIEEFPDSQRSREASEQGDGFGRPNRSWRCVRKLLFAMPSRPLGAAPVVAAPMGTNLYGRFRDAEFVMGNSRKERCHSFRQMGLQRTFFSRMAVGRTLPACPSSSTTSCQIRIHPQLMSALAPRIVTTSNLPTGRLNGPDLTR